jgi:hypothetical protein
VGRSGVPASVIRTGLFAVALALAGCYAEDKPRVAAASSQPSQDPANAPVINVASVRDPSVPDAASVFAAQEAADKAAQQASSQQSAAPQVAVAPIAAEQAPGQPAAALQPPAMPAQEPAKADPEPQPKGN